MFSGVQVCLKLHVTFKHPLFQYFNSKFHCKIYHFESVFAEATCSSRRIGWGGDHVLWLVPIILWRSCICSSLISNYWCIRSLITETTHTDTIAALASSQWTYWIWRAVASLSINRFRNTCTWLIGGLLLHKSAIRSFALIGNYNHCSSPIDGRLTHRPCFLCVHIFF